MDDSHLNVHLASVRHVVATYNILIGDPHRLMVMLFFWGGMVLVQNDLIMLGGY